MKIRVMRLMDRFLGVPLCLLVGTLARAGKPAPPGGPIRTILVIKFFGMGSILLATPFLSALRTRFPHSSILFLSFSSNREILEKLPQPTDRIVISTSSVHAFFRDTVSCIALLRRRKPDVVFDLEFFSKFSTMISTLSNARVRVGYELPARWRKYNITHAIPLDHSAHVVDLFLRQLSALNIPAGTDAVITPVLPSPEERGTVRLMTGAGTRSSRIICVNINAGTTSLERRWAPERFLEVAALMLAERPALHFYFIGSRDERTYVRRHLDTRPDLRGHVTNCAGLLTIGELAALFEQADLLLTNDTGPMHVAASLGTPVVALFGPESPRFYGPRGNVQTLYKALECSPCLNVYNAKLFVCPFNAQCMSGISTGDVMRAINRILTPAESAVS